MKILPVLSHFTNATPVLIMDKNAPIIVPFGPAYSGKTMMLNRLFHYFHVREYCIEADQTFISGNLSSVYEESMDRFIDELHKGTIPVATTKMPLFFNV